MPVYLFGAFVIVKANDAQEARRLAEEASQDVELTYPERARVSLDDGVAEPLEDEDF